MTAEIFELHYHCSNGGDGSVSVNFHKTEQDAESADAAQDEGWGESSASSVKLKLEDGKLYYEDYNGAGREWVEMVGQPIKVAPRNKVKKE